MKQTDFDGTSTYSALVVINYEGPTFALLRVYPNPIKENQNLLVEVTALKCVKEAPLVIYYFLGQKILEKTMFVQEGGTAKGEFFFERPLTSGVFIVKAGPTLQLTQRLVVK